MAQVAGSGTAVVTKLSVSNELPSEVSVKL